MIDGGHRDAFHPDRPDPACPDCQAAARNIVGRGAPGEAGAPAPSTPGSRSSTTCPSSWPRPWTTPPPST